MQTSFTQDFLQSKDGQRINKILRNCVHCGFCNATCPTYQLTGDELDGPRGRIYLIKNFFEQKESSEISVKHLDRCLTCLSCESTCPSGVKYGELIDIGRAHIEKSTKRQVFNKLKRKFIIIVFSNPYFVSIAFSLARTFKFLLPSEISKKIPAKPKIIKAPIAANANRKMFTIKGCVQSCTAPQINIAAAKALQQSNIQLDEVNSQCCGALAFHLTDIGRAKNIIRNNIDLWHKNLTDSYENILITSTGCSLFIKQYASIMEDDKDYADKAKIVSARCKDLSEIIPELKINNKEKQNKIVAFHSPCTLQHGLNLSGDIESLLDNYGFTVVTPKDAHLCCGSAGSYSLLESEFSTKLLQNKVSSIENENPDIIATANIGCLMHLQSAAKYPVKHWIELL